MRIINLLGLVSAIMIAAASSCTREVGQDISINDIIVQYNNQTDHAVNLTMSEYSPKWEETGFCDFAIPSGDYAQQQLSHDVDHRLRPIFSTCVISFDDGKSLRFHVDDHSYRPEVPNRIMDFNLYHCSVDEGRMSCTFNITQDYYLSAE